MANSNKHEERVPFSDPMFNRGNENIKSNNEEKYNDINHHNEYEYYDNKEDKSKNIIVPLVSVIAALGIVGYFGFNYLKQDNTTTKKITTTQNIKKEAKINENKQVEDKKEIATKITPTPITKENKADTQAKDIIASILKEKEKKEATHQAIENTEKKEATHQEVKNIEKKEKEPKPKKIISKTDKKDSSLEKRKNMQKKVIQTLVQKSKQKKHKKIVKNKTKEIKKVQKPKKPQYKVVTVKKGDTLASISKKFYGNPMLFKRIIKANKDIKRASTHLRPGQKIIVPIVEPRKAIAKKTIKKVTKKRRIITVKKGDTLVGIAKRFYGNSSKYKKIINANYKIKNKHTLLHIGQKIYVPR